MDNKKDLAVEERLKQVEETLIVVAEHQKIANRELGKISDTLSIMAELRGEMVSLVRQQQSNSKEHDEIFTRLRSVETHQTLCGQKREDDSNAIAALRGNQRWAILSIFGTLFTVGIGAIIHYFSKG